MLPEQARQRIAEGLGLLGTACAKLGDDAQGEEVLRLAVQYAQEGTAAKSIFLRMARTYVDSRRFGEALGPLRRARSLGAPVGEVLPDLARALFERGRAVGALGCLREARAGKLSSAALDRVQTDVAKRLGPALERWRRLVENG
jgi:Flp pilus assembly protein TadD